MLLKYIQVPGRAVRNKTRQNAIKPPCKTQICVPSMFECTYLKNEAKKTKRWKDGFIERTGRGYVLYDAEKRQISSARSVPASESENETEAFPQYTVESDSLPAMRLQAEKKREAVVNAYAAGDNTAAKKDAEDEEDVTVIGPEYDRALEGDRAAGIEDSETRGKADSQKRQPRSARDIQNILRE